MPELNAKLFGTPAVSVDGREITLPYKKADALLYYLILKRKTTRSELIGLLYEDTDSATALKNLRHAIYATRSTPSARRLPSIPSSPASARSLNSPPTLRSPAMSTILSAATCSAPITGNF